MPNAKNQEMLANVKADLEATSAVWVVDYCGLTVKQIQELRRSVREAGAVMKVYKNTLMHIALADAELPTLDDMLQGPSAFVFCGDDVAAAAKAVKEFAKSNDVLEDQGRHHGRRCRFCCRGGSYRFSAFPRRALRSHRCCYQRCGSGSRDRHRWRAARSGSGHQGCGRPEGSCLASAHAA